MEVLAVGLLALVAGASVAAAVLGVAIAVTVSECSKKALEHVKRELRIEGSRRVLAEMERDGLKKQLEMQSKAIESNALPWYPKTEKLEARYEIEAIDRMENPGFYNDVVEGLGGLH